jgi:hypothetical protein
MTDEIKIEDMSHEELLALNRRIIARLKHLDHIRTHSKMTELRVGEHVAFTPPGYDVIFGVIAKFNRKTVTVVTDYGESWNVSPTQLSRLELGVKENSDSTNIIHMKQEKNA